jgi:8-amino-7-oxononanoate synthase
LAHALERYEREDRRRALRTAALTARHDFSSNDYLGLARDARVIGAFAGSGRAGATGARLLSGAAPEHRALEAALARFVSRDAALLFSSGYLAAIGTIAALAPHVDCIYSDALNHACLIDGIRLARVPTVVYPHRDATGLASDPRAKLVITESLFGMDGDRAGVAALLALLGPDDVLLVDEAHALGVEGARGAGSCAAFDDPRLIVLGTLSKAFGAAGGFVAGPAIAIDYLVSAARTFVFDTALPPALAAAALVAVDLAREADDARARLAEHVERLRAESHIVPIRFGDARAALAAQATLLDCGVLAPAIRPPTVAPGTSRLRVSLSARHDAADLDALIAALERCSPPCVIS